MTPLSYLIQVTAHHHSQKWSKLFLFGLLLIFIRLKTWWFYFCCLCNLFVYVDYRRGDLAGR